MEALYPTDMATARLVPWVQYWAWWLSCAAVSEVTSLGCHSDLWVPGRGEWSGLARVRGWVDRLAPLARASDVVGTLRPDLAAATGLSRQTKVLAGLHDSNTALMAARGFEGIFRNEATVLYNGTWFIAMYLPTLAPGCWPFPQGHGRWLKLQDDWYRRRVAACLYAALVTDAALDRIGSRERLLVEGRFAEAEVFARALASLRPDTAVYVANAHNDRSFGALRMIDAGLVPSGGLRQVVPLTEDLAGYRQAWITHVEANA